MRWKQVHLLNILVVGIVCASAADTPLRSPWDLHPVAIVDNSYTCPNVPALPQDFATNSYYTDPHHSIIDPGLKKKYEDSVAVINDFSRDMVKAADAFQTSGSRAAASCTVFLLRNAARQRALAGTMYGYQASYVQGWNLGAWAVAYLKVRGSGVLKDAETREITEWLKKLAHETREYYDLRTRRGGANDAHNNHLYWAGFAVAAAAIAGDDRGLFRWGLDAYKEGVHDISKDGTLPREMDRGQMALHYHLYALAPLVMIAEFADANGIDLYSEHGSAIRRLVARCVAALGDPSFFQQRTGIAQVTTPQIAGWEISWARPYTRHFPDAKTSELMAQAPELSYTTLGGLPPP